MKVLVVFSATLAIAIGQRPLTTRPFQRGSAASNGFSFSGTSDEKWLSGGRGSQQRVFNSGSFEDSRNYIGPRTETRPPSRVISQVQSREQSSLSNSIPEDSRTYIGPPVQQTRRTGQSRPFSGSQAVGDSKGFIPILRYTNEVPIDGSYSFEFETGNGIFREEKGTPTGHGGAVVTQGSWAFTFPDGTPAEFSFTADKRGYIVESPLLPVGPPLPDHAIAQIEKAKREKAQGIIHDGSYDHSVHSKKGHVKKHHSTKKGTGGTTRYGAGVPSTTFTHGVKS